jgi:hypothetical protein
MSSGWYRKLPVGMLLALGLICGWDRRLFAQEIHLKSRDVRTDSATAARARARNSIAGGRQPLGVRGEPAHEIIQFDHQPGAEDLAALLDAGYRVVAAIPDNAVVAVVPRGTVVSDVIPSVTWQGSFELDDKLSPELAVWPSGSVAAIVEFHADVAMNTQDSLGALEGLAFMRPAFLLANHALVNTSMDRLRALANHDEVAYIFPADPELMAGGTVGYEVLPCAGMLTLAGPIAQYANTVHGWDLDADHVAHLGYYLGAMTPKVPANTVEAEILRAMSAWSAVANVTFSAVTTATAARTIALKFATGAHGDAFPFDGAGGILAHTFYPVPVNAESIAGDMHLDSDENWHAGSDLDIYSVTLHEMGHAIGLGHSNNPGDVMYPYYRRGMVLSTNDIGAARALYGGPASAPASSAALSAVPAPAPSTNQLALTLNPVIPPGQAAQISISGTLKGGVPPFSIQYQTDHGYSGNIAVGSTGTWSSSAVSLVTGTNTITVTAYDAAQHTASQAVTVARVDSPAAANSPVSIRITVPAASVTTTKNSTISIAGTASGGAGVAQVTWQASTGPVGTATGTDHWITGNIPLLSGTNTIVVRAYDSTGASAWSTVVVVKQ